MSAVVCGKRSLFDDLHGSPPLAKRIRCGGGSNSPIRFPAVVSPARTGSVGASEAAASQGRPSVSYLDDHLSQLLARFPDMAGQVVESVYESCGKNLDSAIKSLNDLRLSSTEQMSSSCNDAVHPGIPVAEAPPSANSAVPNDAYGQPPTNQVPAEELKLPQSTGAVPAEGLEWIDICLKEVMSAAHVEDARIRVARVLEMFEKTVGERRDMLLEVLKKENSSLKEQLQGLSRDNHILKRAVTIQHERQLEHDERSRELQAVKQLLTQHQEQLRMLELNNYALTVHLRKAQEGSSIPGRFHPDLF